MHRALFEQCSASDCTITPESNQVPVNKIHVNIQRCMRTVRTTEVCLTRIKIRAATLSFLLLICFYFGSLAAA
jgi:hypothetical protein